MQLISREAQECATFASPDDRGAILRIVFVRNQEPIAILNASTDFDHRRVKFALNSRQKPRKPSRIVNIKQSYFKGA